MSGMNTASIFNPDTGPARVLEHLKKCGKRGATTWDIFENTHCMSVSTVVSEIRPQIKGSIPCIYEGKNCHGCKVYRYYLRKKK